MEHPLEDKYKFLLSLFSVKAIDVWENDAMFVYSGPPDGLLFQFWKESECEDMDKVVEAVMAHIACKEKTCG